MQYWECPAGGTVLTVSLLGTGTVVLAVVKGILEGKVDPLRQKTPLSHSVMFSCHLRTQGLATQGPKGLQSIPVATRGLVTNRGQEWLPKATLRGLFGSWAFCVSEAHLWE